MDDTAAAEQAEETALRRYAPLDSAYDEMVDSAGCVREHWQSLQAFVDGGGDLMLDSMRLETQRRLREQGVHYNVYAAPEGQRRTWQLDPVPLLLTEQEWPALEEGLIQRARLFNMLLRDIYGPQRSLREGLIPHEVVLRHPEFIRTALNSDMLPLTLYAVDLARGPDGCWWVLSDRSQGPSGAGYVLEARFVTRRVLGRNVSDYDIAPVAQFFQHFKRHVAALAPDQQKDPTIALLSPGLGNEVYFEHVYLAAQTGITLVEGGDLTVRRGQVFLRTVDDLRRVDVLIRRVDSNYCDPLSLRGDSMLGVPGLMQAQALGSVGMANPIGSGALESPGLLPFLPALAREWLGEELKLPSVATWWCGQRPEREFVLEHLERLVIKRIDQPGVVIFGDGLDRRRRQSLTDEIRARPWCFVGQETLKFSTVPTLAESSLQPRHLVLRSFLAGNGEEYDVMPGGLTRVAPRSDTFVVSTQSGGWSKDTWLLRRSGARPDALRLHPGGQRRLAAAALTSRAAEHLYWAATYFERSESLLRHLRAYLKRLDAWFDYGFDIDARALRQWMPALELYMPDLPRKGGLAEPSALKEMLLDGDSTGSLVYNLRHALNDVYTVRDLWPVDSWRAIEDLEERLLDAGHHRERVLEQIIQPLLSAILAFRGATTESMALTQGGLWLQIGRRLERVQNILLVALAEAQQFASDDESLVLESLLEAHDCSMSHRRRYGFDFNYYTVWYHLLLEANNPRSLIHQLLELEALLKSLSPGPQYDLTPPEKSLLAVLTRVRLAEPRQWASADASRVVLAPFLDGLRRDLQQLAGDLDQQYFRHTLPLTQFAL